MSDSPPPSWYEPPTPQRFWCEGCRIESDGHGEDEGLCMECNTWREIESKEIEKMGSKGQGLQFFLDDFEKLTKDLERMTQRFEGMREVFDNAPGGRETRRTLDMYYRVMLDAANSCLKRTTEAVEKAVCPQCDGAGKHEEPLGVDEDNDPVWEKCSVCEGSGLRQDKGVDGETQTSVPF